MLEITSVRFLATIHTPPLVPRARHENAILSPDPWFRAVSFAHESRVGLVEHVGSMSGRGRPVTACAWYILCRVTLASWARDEYASSARTNGGEVERDAMVL